MNQSVGLGHPQVLMLHCMIFHELIQSQMNTSVKYQDLLYDVLDDINKHIGETSPREKLKEFTVKLDIIAQELDSSTFRLDQSQKNMKMLSKSHDLLEAFSRSSSGSSSPFSLIESIERLQSLLDQEKSYLSYLNIRRETAMNLVRTTSSKELDVNYVTESKTGFQSRKST